MTEEKKFTEQQVKELITRFDNIAALTYAISECEKGGAPPEFTAPLKMMKDMFNMGGVITLPQRQKKEIPDEQSQPDTGDSA